MCCPISGRWRRRSSSVSCRTLWASIQQSLFRAILMFALMWVPGEGAVVRAFEPAPDLEVFVRAGCPHCEAVKAFLHDLQERRPGLRILIQDVSQDRSALARFELLWPKYWSFSFSVIPSKEIPGLISFRMDWLDLLAVQGTLKSLLQHHSSK